MTRATKRSGFTLIELILVITIIGVLAAMVVPRFVGRSEDARKARAKADIASIGTALDLYELDIGEYPATLEDLAAREAPTGVEANQWNGPYLKKGLPKDPWGRTYVYNAQSQRAQDFDLYSLGKDGQPGNDDITNWE